MPPFAKREKIPIDELLENERAEFSAVSRGLGISEAMGFKEAIKNSPTLLKHLEGLVKDNHHDKPWVYYALGALYFQDGKLEEAAIAWSHAAKVYPADPRASYHLGNVYYGLAHRTEFQPLHDGPEDRRLSTSVMVAREKARQYAEQNHQIVRALRESKLVGSRQEAVELALKHLRQALACNISKDDKRKIDTQIRELHLLLSLHHNL